MFSKWAREYSPPRTCTKMAWFHMNMRFIHSNHTGTTPLPVQTGFGLGLKLIRKIVTRFDWALQEQQRDSVLHMTVVFESGEAGGG